MEPIYPLVVDANWTDRSLFPESIPHLFHQDLAYLWMLEREPERRSKTWEERVEGWKLLVTLFLLGQIELEPETIREPFASFTRPFGIDEVTWLRQRGESGTRVGVLSPTVLVRPLPDFKSADLANWKRWAGLLNSERDTREVRHFADLAINALESGAPEPGGYRARLARILTRAFGREALGHAPAGQIARISVLRSLGWAGPRDASTGPESVSLLIKETGDPRVKVLVPRCRECNDLLTRGEAEAPVVVNAAAVRLTCAKGHTTEIDLADFLIAQAPGSRVVLWEEDASVTLPNGSLPPRHIEGIEVRMTWDPGRVGGSPRRHLRLQFPGATLERHRLDEVFFDKLLVPGRFEAFTGTPIRPEWSALVEDWGKTEPDPSVPRVTFRDLRLRGWPVPILRVLGNLSLERREDVAVGLYPDPRDVGAPWKWYRIFADGPGRQALEADAPGAQPLLPWLAECKGGVPPHACLRLKATPHVGVTFPTGRLSASSGAAAALGGAPVFLGIDFGTANTVVRYDTGDSEATEHSGTDIEPARLSALCHWLAPPVTEDWPGPVGDFLPPRRYGDEQRDPCLVPSALWRVRASRLPVLIRWGQWFLDGEVEPPSADLEPLGGFKWDPSSRPGHFEQERVFFLKELLLLVLPAILKQWGSLRPAEVKLGMAFPLAFDAPTRKGMSKVLGMLATECLQLVGLRLNALHVSESLACVNAFGLHRIGEVFLVADLGGGTLDVALFRIGAPQNDVLQIGSLRFGGEEFIEALAGRKHADTLATWELRDLIATGGALQRYGDDADAEIILRRSRAIVGEFLRTMIAAFRRHEVPPRQAIKVVLVGNGWHLAETFSRRAVAEGWPEFFKNYYAGLLTDLGEPDVELYTDDILRGLKSSKHLVVRGALQNTRLQQRDELGGKIQLSKLPAGRTVTTGRDEPLARCIEWHRLVGDDRTLEIGPDGSQIRSQEIDFDLQDMPPLPLRWHRELSDAFGVASAQQLPYPNPGQLRAQVAHGFRNNLMSKGPLQLIIEHTWAKKLGEY